jgi:hypothetical protein
MKFAPVAKAHRAGKITNVVGRGFTKVWQEFVNQDSFKL